MKIGILGGTGMLGHHIAIAAQLRNYEVIIIHRKSSNLTRIEDLQCETRIADMNDRGALIRACKGLDILVNAAAYYPTLPVPLAQEIKTARNQMIHFLDAVKEAEIPRAMYLGSPAVIPVPKSGLGHEELYFKEAPHGSPAYFQVKWLMDKMAREAGLNENIPVTIGMPPMTFGEYDYTPTTGRFIVDVAKQRLPAYLKGLGNVIYAGDAGRGLLAVTEKGKPGERYLINGHNTSTTEIVETICEVSGIPVLKKTIPLKVAKVLSKMQETRYTLFGGKPPKLSSTAIAVLSGGQHLDGSKAKEELNYEPEVEIKDAIRRAYNWFVREGYLRKS